MNGKEKAALARINTPCQYEIDLIMAELGCNEEEARKIAHRTNVEILEFNRENGNGLVDREIVKQRYGR
jgi:hypothetical protein